jgi:hypothetical protein
MKYLNMKTVYGVETIDQLSPEDYNTYKDFRAELRRLVGEYHMAGMNVYISQRCDKTWNN